MSDTTRDINRVTGAIIKVSLRLIIYALLILIFYEGITAGFEFATRFLRLRQWLRLPAGIRPSG